MNAILSAFWWEARVCLARNMLFVTLSLLLVLLVVFKDFPFSPPEAEENAKEAAQLGFLIDLLLVLAIFGRSVIQDLDDRWFFAQHPLDYRLRFIGKCLFVFLLNLSVTLLSFAVHGLAEWEYGNSLGSISANPSESIATEMANCLFMAGFILCIALCRPLHYALLTGFVMGAFYLADAHPGWREFMPLWSRSYQASLLGAPLPWLLGMYIYQWQMRRSVAAGGWFGGRRGRWLSKLRLRQWAPWAVTLACIGFAVYLNTPRNTMSPVQAARTELANSLRGFDNQGSAESRYFRFKFQHGHQAIADALAGFADQEWRRLHEEFGIDFDEAGGKLDVFIKPSNEHQLGSTRGAFVIINADRFDAADRQALRLRKTLRHELTHVLINRQSDYRLANRKDIFAGFFHEGLAELAENNWNAADTARLQEAALNYRVYDRDLIELLPKIGWVEPYDYELNYSFGYVFWLEFAQLYGRDKIRDFLWQLGEFDDADRQYQGLQFLFHKARQADIDLYKVLQAAKTRLQQAAAGLDRRMLAETLALNNFKAAGLDGERILIPYQFPAAVGVECKFRRKDSLQSRSVAVDEWSYQGRQAGTCPRPEAQEDELQLLVGYAEGVVFRSRWIEAPGRGVD